MLPDIGLASSIKLDEPKNDITTFYFMCKRPYTVDPPMRLRSRNYIFNQADLQLQDMKPVNTMKYAHIVLGLSIVQSVASSCLLLLISVHATYQVKDTCKEKEESLKINWNYRVR